MCALAVIYHKFNRNPDNIIPAVASCLGDLVNLVLLGFVSALLVPFIQTSMLHSFELLVFPSYVLPSLHQENGQYLCRSDRFT
jgi:solute carrier family 41